MPSVLPNCFSLSKKKKKLPTETNNPAADTKSEPENSNETLSPTTLDASAPASENLTVAAPPASGEAMNGDSKAKEAQCERSEPADDVENKIRRAERFGVPLQLSEQEKRSSRAERFGTESGPGALNSSEEQKRKSRAERFGLEANSAVDNEENKKALLARFGSNTKIDSQEEEKRKARALRFAQSPADSQTHTDREATQKTAVRGNAIGGT